jgi:hypothetical protein
VADAVDAAMLDKQPAGAHPVIDLRHGHARPQERLPLDHPVRADAQPPHHLLHRPDLTRHREVKSGQRRNSPPPGGGYALDSSLPTRAAYRDRTRRSRASGEGHAATSAPSTAIAPPIQIQTTSGETIARKLAGGGSDL